MTIVVYKSIGNIGTNKKKNNKKAKTWKQKWEEKQLHG